MLKNRKLHSISIFFLYFLIAFDIFASLGFKTTHDDVWFPLNYVKFDSMTDWIIHRYNTWSGRIAIEMVLPHVLSANVWYWRLLNISAFLVMTTGILALGGDVRKLPAAKQWLAGTCVLFLIFVTDRGVLEGGMFWATGSMNYLWPTACLCLALLPYSRLLTGTDIHVSFWILILPAALYASYQEQTSLILVCFSIISLFIYRITNKKWCIPGIILTIILLINFFILVSAPGNYNRLQQEIIRFYPNFNTVPILQKLYHGVNYTLLNHWFYESVKPFLFIVGLTFLIGMQKTESRGVRFFIALPLVYVLFSIVFAKWLGKDFAHLLNFDIYDTNTIRTGVESIELNLIPVILNISMMFLVPIIWYLLFGFSETFLKLILFYFAGIFSSVIISFSPTIFASGYRVFFVPGMMMVIVALLLFMEALRHIDIKNKVFAFLYGALAVVGLSEIIKLSTIAGQL